MPYERMAPGLMASQFFMITQKVTELSLINLIHLIAISQGFKMLQTRCQYLFGPFFDSENKVVIFDYIFFQWG